jgi:hypothetical protein
VLSTRTTYRPVDNAAPRRGGAGRQFGPGIDVVIL